MTQGNRFHQFWQDQVTTLWGPGQAEITAREMSLLSGSWRGLRVLDLGCGDGHMAEAIGLSEVASYQGVDISQKMLDIFIARYPAVKLHCGPIHKFHAPMIFDIVLACGVVQYLSSHEVRQLANALRPLVKEGGRVVLGAIPHRSLRWNHYGQNLTKNASGWSLKQMIGMWLAGLGIRRDVLGYWSKPLDIVTAFGEGWETVSIHGALSCDYRFHLVLRRGAGE